MKKLLLIPAFLVCFFCTAQETLTYCNEGENYQFKVSQAEYYITFNEADKESIEARAKKFTKLSAGTALIKTDESALEFNTRKANVAKDFDNQLLSIEPVLIWNDGARQVCNGQLIVKLKDKSLLNEVLQGRAFTATADRFVAGQYLVKVENISTENLFAVVTRLAAHKDVDFAEPDFITFTKLFTTDTHYASQWSINNAGYLGGAPDADMDVDDAWALATGSGIKIAIVDIGVDLTHPDLAANLWSTGYDATGWLSNGSYEFNDYHGTACAGIAAAVANNEEGIAGVAYNAKIIPVRMGYLDAYGALVSSHSQRAGALNWSVTNGADIISCSWGGGSSSTAVNNAINNAVNNGRNGKGCVVLFATGNNNTSVSWPATRPNVIAVGATNMFDERKSPQTAYHDECWYQDCSGGSNYGTELDVVAPGVKIYTTDIHGSAGDNFGDYKSDFNGTSAACPNAAGVAALILSANPNLTYTQARQILESSTDKPTGYTYAASSSAHPNGTWNNEVGYGRLNACQAVTEAYKSIMTISGASIICSTQTYQISNLPPGSAVTWSSTWNSAPYPTLVHNSPNANELTINNTYGYPSTTTLTATITGPCGNIVLTKQIMSETNTQVQYGSYTQQACYVNGLQQPALSGSLSTTGSATYLHQLCTAEITLTQMVGKTVAFTGTQQPVYWSYNSNNSKLTLQLPLGSGGVPFTFKISGTGACQEKTLVFFSFLTYYNQYAFSVSPNPVSSEYLTILAEPNEELLKQKSTRAAAEDLDYTVTITDLATAETIGQPVNFKNSLKQQLNISTLPQGLYNLKISTGNETQTIRFLKQ